jgi:hypothetical protein
MKHLWEYDHPYYCNDGNYYANDTVFYHDSWALYMKEFADADKDYNLVFRWDWKRPVDDEFGEFAPDDALHLYHMAQRKGAFWVHIVRVEEADEDSVREYLTEYAEHMKKIWEPLL